MNRLIKTITPFVATFAAGLVGMMFVGSDVASWYASLAKPAFTPPNIVFPIAWTTLYILMAIACAIVWRVVPQNAHTEGWVRFYFIQLMLNTGWTIFFFGFHSITIAIVDTLVLGFMVIGLTGSAWEIDRRVTYLMLPYAIWIGFALYLTIGVWMLN